MANASLILAPYETEKSVRLAAHDQYTFLVAPNATKIGVRQAFMELYGMKPVKVTMVTTKAKFRGQNGRRKKAAGKKAIVVLPKGAKIDLSKFRS